MTTIQILCLAIVQGLTEFLPISSSAHLILVNRLLGYADEGLLFDVAVHAGSLAAVMLYFRKDIAALLANATVPDFPEERGHTLLLWLAAATLPIAVAGVTFAGGIEAHLRSTAVIGWATLVFGLLLGWATLTHKGAGTRLTLAICLIVGLAQVFALIPGASRSGVTMAAALFCGLGAVRAARLSFLLAIPAVAAAATFGAVEAYEQQASLPIGMLVAAVFFSGVAAYVCIAAFLALLARIGMLPFVVYRLALGLVLLVIAWT